MEVEEDEYVSVEDSEICPVDSGTNYWNTVLGPPEDVEGVASHTIGEDVTLVHEEETSGIPVEEDDDNEEDNREPLSFELQQGYRILRELMAESNKSVNWHFLEAVDDSYPETQDYYDRIKSPMWLEKMNEKFQNRQYQTITEFVADFRLMLENCFRYNGPDHYVSKRGQRLETMLEQKLALLSRELREKTSIAATSGQSGDDSFSASGLRRRVKAIIPHDSSALLNHLREEELKQQREQRRQVIAERKAAQEAYLSNLQEWEDQLMGESKKHLKAMWELPAIGHFLFLCQEPLNLDEVAHYELEHCFMMPRQSSTMQRVMSSLLSTPFQRTKLDKKTMMPYYVWEEKLRKRLIVWYKTLTDNGGNIHKAAYKLGIDAFFFDVVGMKNPLLKKKFHELSFYRKVWIVKSLCDNCLESQESLRDAMEVQPVEEQRSYVLGEDAKGNTYIHFPQFCGADLRVYRQDPLPEPEIYSSDDEEEEAAEEESEDEEEVNTPPVKKRKVDNNSKLASKTDSKQSPVHRRSRRGGQKPSDVDETEPENTPSEVSTDPGSRSMTATPELMDEEERLPIRRTRSGKARRNLYQNGLTQDLERSLRKLRRSRVESKKSGREESPSIASDSEREYSSVTDSNHNNNVCTTMPDEQDAPVHTHHYKQESLSFTGMDSGSYVVKQSNDNKDSIKTESGDNDSLSESQKKCDIKSMDMKIESCEGHLCKENGSCGAEHWNGQIDGGNKSAITNGDISKENFNNSAVKGESKLEVSKGIGGSVKMDRETGDGAPLEMRKDVKTEATLTGTETSAQSITNGAESDSMSRNNHYESTQDLLETSKESTVPGDGLQIPDSDAAGQQNKGDSAVKEDTRVNEERSDRVKQEQGGEELKHKTDCEEEDQNTADDFAKLETGEKLETVNTEEEESDEELNPEIGSFELVADTVEDLRLLADKFAEQAEPPLPVTTRGKKAKAWRPPTRKRCVVELHDRLLYLLKELEPWEPKLIQARRRAQVKMRRELDEYKEEIMKDKEAEEWNTEDSSDDTDNEVNGSVDDKEEEPKTKKSSTAPSIQSTDSRDSLMGNAEEEYEPDVSSRGRLRKRRVIPNNIEDQGIKKKKVIKPGEDTGLPTHLPNILQKQMKPTSAAPSSQLTVSGTMTNPMQSLSASQILRMSILSHAQTKTSLASPSLSNIHLSTVGKSGVSVTQSSHPVIQSLLTTRSQQGTPSVLRQVRPKPPVINTGKPQTGVSPSKTPTGSTQQTLEVTGGNTPSSTQKILNSLPASVIQQLLKHKAIKIQTTGPGGTTLFLTSAVPTSSVLTSTTIQNQPPSAAKQVTAPAQLTQMSPEVTVSTHSVISNVATTPAAVGINMPYLPTVVTQAKVINQQLLQQSSQATALVTPQLSTIPGSISSVLSPSHPVLGSLSITTTAKPVLLTPNGQGQTSPVMQPNNPHMTADTSLVDNTSIKPYLSPSAVSPSKQKYASNVTVKALLENRASQKSTDIQSVVSRTDVMDVLGTETVIPREGTRAKSNMNMCKVILSSAGGQFKPRVLKIPSQEALDSALQSVVTSVSTSLPTANIKVPSPVTLPSIQPRRNVTKTIQSMKAPIPVAHKVDSNPAVTMTSPSSLSQSASQPVTSLPYSHVTKSPMKTGYVLQSPVPTTNTNQKNMLLKVVPQNFLTSQGLVQGYLTPQGLVIPQNKQTVVSGTGSSPASVSAEAVPSTKQVQMASGSSIKDQAVLEPTAVKPVVQSPVVVTQAGKQIQLSYSPAKQASSLSSVQGLIPQVPDVQLTGNNLGSRPSAPVTQTISAIQSQCTLTSATITTASKSGKGVKSSQVQTKVATPAAELVKQIAAGQSSSIHNTRMMVPASAHIVQGKGASSGMTALIGKPQVSGSQAASVIPALMVGQPAMANSLNTPRLLLPAQQLVGAPLQSAKTVSLNSTPEVASKQPVLTSSGPTLQLQGKTPASPFVLSLGSGLQNVILSPSKDLSSQTASHMPATALQISVPQSVVKTTAIAPSVATLQLPVQSMQLNQHLASTLQVNPHPPVSGIQVIQQQVAGTNQTVAPAKQILLSPQQVGNIALPSGIRLVSQQSVGSGIQTLINKATPQLMHQRMAAVQVTGGSQPENKSPVVLQQQVLPVAANTPSQIVQLGQQQLLINKSIPQQLTVASPPVQAGPGAIQPSLKLVQSAGNQQQGQILQFQTPTPFVSATASVPASNLNTNRSCIQAAQPATKAALQAHLNQTKQSGLVHGSKPEMPTLSTILGHEKGKVATHHKQTLKTADKGHALQTQSTLSSIIVSTMGNGTVNAPSIKTTAGGGVSSSVVGDAGGNKQQKLLLYNIGGQLMTAQGVPVTVEQGVLKVVPQATIQIGNQMLTIRSPSSAMVENPTTLKASTKEVSPGGLSTLQPDNSVPTVAMKSVPVAGPASSSNLLIQATIQSAAGFTPVNPTLSPDTRLLQTGMALTEHHLNLNSQGFSTRVNDSSSSSFSATISPHGEDSSLTKELTGPTEANNVNTGGNSVMKNVQINALTVPGKVQSVPPQTVTTDNSKPLLQKSGSREEAALNLLSLANMSER